MYDSRQQCVERRSQLSYLYHQYEGCIVNYTEYYEKSILYQYLTLVTDPTVEAETQIMLIASIFTDDHRIGFSDIYQYYDTLSVMVRLIDIVTTQH